MNEKLAAFSINHVVRVVNDTCFVTSSNDDLSGVQINLTDPYKIYYKGQRLNFKEKDTVLSGKIITIQPTGKIKTIVNYVCENYISVGSSFNISIWFCKALPNAINPGLTNLSSYPGAILSFEVEGKFGIQKMEARDIKIIK